MTIIADPRYAAPVVFHFVNTLNKMLSETDGSSQGPGAGTQRRIIRERAKAKRVAAYWKKVEPLYLARQKALRDKRAELRAERNRQLMASM